MSSRNSQTPTGELGARRVTKSPPVDFVSVEHIVSNTSITEAWKKVRTNKGAPGADGISIEQFPKWVRPQWNQIKNQLLAGTYKPSPALRVEIPKESGGVRCLGIPCVLDRVLMQAIAIRLGEIFNPTFSDNSFGYRPYRSVQQAARRAQRYYQEGHRIQIDIDLEKFFDTVNHDILMERVGRKVKNKGLLKLLGKFLRAGVMVDGRLQPTRLGVPQGSPVSPILSNILLDELDKELEKRGHKFIRYADDRVPRRRTVGRKPTVQPCCTRDEGGPLEAAVQVEASNHPLLLPLREVVVSELGKGRAGPCQVRTVESNASEPLMTCRKRWNDVKTGGESLLRDQSGGYLSTAQAASGMKAARMRSRLLCGTWEPVTPMRRERHKRKPLKCLSTDAGYRDGATRSSDEGPVMGLERRGCPIWLGTREQLATGGLS